MNDQSDSQQTDDPSTACKPPWLVRRVDHFKKQLENHRAEKYHETTIDRATRSTKRATWIIAVATIVTSVAAIYQYSTLGGQLHVMQRTLDEMRDEQRAWLSIKDIKIESISIGKPYEVIVEPVNTGRDPAQDTHVGFGVSLVSIGNFVIPHMGEKGDLFWRGCRRQIPVTGAGILFPNGGDYIHIVGGTWTESLDKGTETLVWNVCLTYRTEQKIHHTAVCFFYRSSIMKSGHFSRCRDGDYAD